MKCVAGIMVDLETSPLGTRSRLADGLHGVPVLRRTVDRIARAKRIDAIALLTTHDQADRVTMLLGGGLSKDSDVRPRQAPRICVEPVRIPPAPCAELIRAGRWWGLDSWRGGPGALTVFDEDMNSTMLAALAKRHEAEVIVVVPAAAALVDPDLIDAMIDHYDRHAREYHFTFAQSPPGLAPLVIDATLLAQLARANEPFGPLMAYQPERPFPDLTGKEPCYRPAAEAIEASGRLICDTWRSFERVRDLIAAGGEDWPAPQIGVWLQQRAIRGARSSASLAGRSAASFAAEPVPTEIELELTTAKEPCPNSNPDSELDSGSESVAATKPDAALGIGDREAPFSLVPATYPLPPGLLRPDARETGTRGPMSLDVLRQVCEAIEPFDDVRVVLGGHGDPCHHPAFAEVCRLLRPRAAAIAVRTFARDEDPATDDALFETPVDVIEVMLDATTRETYAKLHGVDAFEDVCARLERWIARREKAARPRPLIVPSMVKCRENLGEVEPFFKLWHARLGMVLITGHSDYAGTRQSHAVTSMTPPHRGACRRAASRVSILADGRVTTCDQDFAGVQIIGTLGPAAPPGEAEALLRGQHAAPPVKHAAADSILMNLWTGESLNRIRQGDFTAAPLCASCKEWHRP